MAKNENVNISASDFDGFLFCCTKSHVNRPISLSAAEVAKLPAECRDENKVFLKCKACDKLMVFTEGSSEWCDGRWTCPECGRTVHKDTPYNILDELNRTFEKRWLK